MPAPPGRHQRRNGRAAHAAPPSMSYSYGGGSSMGAFHGMAGQGYSYAALVSSSDPGDSDRTSFSRRPSTAGARPRVDRRYSPPPPRHRAETGPSSVYKSLQSGLTQPRTALTRCGPHGRGRRLSAPKPKERRHKHDKHDKHDKHYKKARRKSSKAGKGRCASTSSSKKPSPKGKSKGMFGWGCFGI